MDPQFSGGPRPASPDTMWTMDNGANMFYVRPEQLSGASKEMGTASDELGRTRHEVTLVPPAEAFGLLPEAADLAAALARSVQAATDDLDTAVGAADRIGTGLAGCAQNYVDHDTRHAAQIRRVVNS